MTTNKSQWVTHQSTMNPGMYYYIHRTKRHVVAYCRERKAWVIRLARMKGVDYPIAYFNHEHAMFVAGMMN